MFYKGSLLALIYILGGILLEDGFGFTSPALFSFYGYMMALLTFSVTSHHYEIQKQR